MSSKAEFTIEEICEHSQELFGVYPEVIRGALCGKEKDKMNVAAVKVAIDVFLKKEVK